jgi:hypothetical protein
MRSSQLTLVGGELVWLALDGAQSLGKVAMGNCLCGVGVRLLKHWREGMARLAALFA